MNEADVRARFQRSPLGGTTKLLNPFGMSGVTVSPDPLTIPDQRERILEADLLFGDDPIYSSGSWVLTVDSFAKFDSTNPPNPIVPVRAIIELGTGGVRQVLEVDARNTSIQLPAGNITVDISWDETLPVIIGNFSGQWSFPTEVRITATLQRGVARSSGTRTIWLPLDGTNPVSGLQGIIPNFAKCVRVWGPRSSPFFGAASNSYLQFLKEPTGVQNNIMMQYLGPNLENPSGVPIPNQAQIWEFDTGTSVANIQALEFDIEL